MNNANKIIKYLAIAFGIFLIFNIVSGIMYCVVSVSNMFDHESIELKQLDVSKENILNIDVSTANIIIKKAEEFKIETNNENISYIQSEGKLSIKENKRNWFKKYSSDLIIYVPTETLFEQITIKNGAGRVNVDYLITQELTLNLGAGKVEIDYLQVKNKAKIDGGAGEIVISNGIINNLDMDMGVGKLSLSASITGNSQIDAGVGQLEIILNGQKDDYMINVDKGLGSFKISGENIIDGKIYGNGDNKLDIDGGVGSINIEFTNNQEQIKEDDMVKNIQELTNY